jgi:hypothetical protein
MSRILLWIKSGRTQIEHILSAFCRKSGHLEPTIFPY